MYDSISQDIKEFFIFTTHGAIGVPHGGKEEEKKFFADMVREFDISKASKRFHDMMDLITVMDAGAWDIFTEKNLGVDKEEKLVILDISAMNKGYEKVQAAE